MGGEGGTCVGCKCDLLGCVGRVYDRGLSWLIDSLAFLFSAPCFAIRQEKDRVRFILFEFQRSKKQTKRE